MANFKALRHNGSQSGVPPASTAYLALADSSLSTTSTEAQRHISTGNSFTIERLTISTDYHDTTTGFTSVRPRINSANGNIIILIPAGTTGIFTSAGGLSDSVATDDEITTQIVTASGGTDGFFYRTAYICSTAAVADVHTGFFVGNFTQNTNLTRYYTLVSQGNNATESPRFNVNMNVAGTFKNFQANVITNTVNASSTARTRKNLANGSQSVTIPALTTGIIRDTSNTDTIAANDDYDYQVVTGNSVGTSMVISLASDYYADGGTSFIVWADSETYTNTSTVYLQPGGTDSATTELFVQAQYGSAFIASNTQVNIETNTHPSASTLRSRRESNNTMVDGNIVITIPASTTGWITDSSNKDYIGDDEVFNYSVTWNGSGGSTSNLRHVTTQMLLVEGVSTSDAVAIAESVTVDLTKLVSVFDAVSIAESTSQTQELNTGVVFDAVSIAENTAQTQVFNNGSVFDAVSITESVSVQKVIEQSVSDDVSIIDDTADALNKINFVSVFDAITIAEDVATQRIDQAFETSVFDAISVAENVTLEKTSTQTTFDAIGFTESVTTLAVRTTSVSDDVTIAESISQVLALTNSVSDAVSIAESVTLERTATQSVAEAVSVAENTSNEVATTVSTSDALSIAEAVTLLHQDSDTASVSDAVSILEDIVTSMTTSVSVFDAIALTESVASEQFFVVSSAVDAVAISESVSVETIRFSPEKPLDRPRGYSDPDETFIGGSFVTTNMTVGGGI